MDKYYVINITDNLDDLNQDMLDWNMLPTDFKMTGNDNCIAQYGCTVTDLYNRLKNKILNHKEIMKDKEKGSNIVFESSFFDDPEYKDRLKKSQQFQTSPFIVIIDPNDNQEELISKYSNFLLLDNKYRRISDYHSWNIWGYSVYNMYNIVSNILNSEAEDSDSNIVLGEVANYDSCLDGAYNFLNKAILEGDILTIEKFKQNNIITKPVFEVIYNYKLGFLNDRKVGENIFPKVVPWFTAREMNEYCSECTINPSKYYKQLKEAYNSDDKNSLISLGWNPTVPITNETLKDALSRQVNEASNMNVYDISKMSEYKDYDKSIKFEDLNLLPIYFVFWNDSVAVAFPDRFKLSSSLRIMYKFEANDNIFIGFKKIFDTDIDLNANIRLISIFVDVAAYDILFNNIAHNQELEKLGSRNFNSIYSVLLKSRDINDPDRMKVVYSYYIDILLKLICFNAESDEITDPHYIDSRLKTIFSMYNGPYKDYNPADVETIMHIIWNEVNLKKYLSANEFDLDKELISKLTPNPCIYNSAE